MICRSYPGLRVASIILILAGVLSNPLFIIGQDCSSFTGKTYKDLESQSAGLKRSLVLVQQRAESANRRIWNNANIAGTYIYNFNLGLFLGRAEDYEELDQTLDQANRAFRAGNRKLGFATTLDIFKEAKAMASGIGGVLGPAPYSAIPSTPKEAWDFVKNASKSLHNFRVDGQGSVVALARTGDAMEESENALIAAGSLRQQIATLQRCMSYAPHTSTSVAKPEEDGYGAQRQALMDRARADNNAEFACNTVAATCRSACTGPGLIACLIPCNNAEVQCMAPLDKDWKATMQSVNNLDAKHYGFAPPE